MSFISFEKNQQLLQNPVSIHNHDGALTLTETSTTHLLSDAFVRGVVSQAVIGLEREKCYTFKTDKRIIRFDPHTLSCLFIFDLFLILLIDSLFFSQWMRCTD